MKRVFITGGASGLGKALAEKFAYEGFAVCIGDINDELGKEVANDIASKFKVESQYLSCDVRREADLQSAADFLTSNWQGVDVAINNAGVAASSPIETDSMDDWQWILDINVLGVARGSKVFAKLFKEQGSGYFINIASMAGVVHLPFMSSYNVSKAAVIALSETLAVELMPQNVGVSVVCPSFFKTNLDASMRSNEAMKKSVQKLFEHSEISAEDVANMTYDAYEKQQFFVVTHPKGKLAFDMKKQVPIESFHKGLFEESKGLRKLQ